jgi:hypothetical protein
MNCPKGTSALSQFISQHQTFAGARSHGSFVPGSGFNDHLSSGCGERAGRHNKAAIGFSRKLREDAFGVRGVPHAGS